MVRAVCAILLAATLAAAAISLAGPTSPPSAPASRPDADTQPDRAVVAVAPFPSTGDDGDYGKAVTNAFQLKLARWPLADLIDRFTYADLADAAGVQVRWSTPAGEVARFARDTLGAAVLIYGDVKVAGRGAALRVRAVDLRAGPTLALDRTFELSYPTQLRPAVEIVLNQLVGYSTVNREVPALVKLTPAMERRWRDEPNLVPNGEFDEADSAGRLARWEAVLAEQRFAPPRFGGAVAPLVTDYGRHCLWADDPADAANRVVHMPVSEAVAATYGVACYSDWIPITPGCIYRLAVRWRTDGPTPKVFIKGYALRPTPGERDAGRAMAWQRREVYRRQVHPTSDADPKRDLGRDWTETTADFCPRHERTPPHWVRIDLYAYWPKGHVWFDRVVLKQLSEQPAVEQRDPEGVPKDPTTAPDAR